MEHQTELQREKVRQDRITLAPESAKRLDVWLEELRAAIPAVRVSRSDIVNWLVNSHSEKLTSREMQSVKDSFFDEVAFAEWALKALREARSRGESLTLESILEGRSGPSEPKKEKRPRKPAENNPQKEELNAEDGDQGAVGATTNTD